MAFVHLHTHTQYSLLDGSNKIKDYVARVKELGMNAAAITDHGVMYGVIDFYKECKAAGINPILGCEVYVAPGSRFDRESGGQHEERYYHLILLAENNQGYANLMKIVSRGFIDGYYYKPRIDKELLEKYHEGLICTSACLAGEVQKYIASGMYDRAKETALWYNNVFGQNNYFLELQDHGQDIDQTVDQGLMRLSQDTGIPLVATNDCHYTNAEDWEAHDVLLCIQTGKKLSDTDRMRYEGGQYYVKSEEEMRALFPYAPEALENTQKIADRCHVEIEFGVTKLPHYETPEGYDSWTFLNKLCQDGLVKRYGDRAPELKPQLDYELGVIKKMGYVDYFLIVWDYINFARTHGIPVGPGRGSAAGSLVSYTTGITNIDPIRYQLLFERFLNPERVTMPDIDVDFDYERRGEVIDYVTRKYGKDCVTQIITFGTMAARNAIRDVGRVMDLPYGFVDTVAKSIPRELNITIDKALEENPDLKKMYDTDETVKSLIDTARKLEGLPRNASTHAAGVVISQKPMDEYVPLARGADGNIVTQFTMTTIEELGLLKMDFLGLRTLTVIRDAVEDANKNNPGLNLNIDDISYEDPKVYEMIGSGRCEGVFQLESAGMKNFMKELKPENLEDVIAGISLYRPGPMDFIPKYIEGKKHPDQITYDCPQLIPILKPTYGCIVYQEQVMQIVQQLAGFSLGRADLVRRAMSKKKTHVMEEERKNFVYGNPEENVPGCIANGIDEATANHIYDEMIDFAKYAFNKSHAACYAVVSYQTAYLKCYYPKEFMASLMTSFIDNTSKVSQYIQICRNMGIRLLPPDINTGDGRFTATEDGIRYGMYAVKSVGTPVINEIIKEREANGPFTSLEDFINRVSGTAVNKRAVENLIKAGACDCLGCNRRQMIYSYQEIMDQVANKKKNDIEGQMSLFDFADDQDKKAFSYEIPDVEEFDRETLLAFEKEVLGIYVSGHPLENYTDEMRANVTAQSAEFVVDDETGTAEIADGRQVVIGGMMTEKTIKFTKKNQPMAFITIEDLVGSVEVIVFPNTFEKCRDILTDDAKLFVSGRVSAEEDKDAKLIAEDIRKFEDAPKEVWIQMADMDAWHENQAKLQEMCSGSEGSAQIVVYLKAQKAVQKMPSQWNISMEDGTLKKLQDAFGEENVRMRTRAITFRGRNR